MWKSCHCRIWPTPGKLEVDEKARSLFKQHEAGTESSKPQRAVDQKAGSVTCLGEIFDMGELRRGIGSVQ